MNRSWALFGILGAALLGYVGSRHLDAMSHSASFADVGEVLLKDLKDPSADGQAFEEFLGQPLVVNFWASWCESCAKETPRVMELSGIAEGHEVKFLGVATADQYDKAALSPKIPLAHYPQVFDVEGALAQKYKVHHLPQTLLLGPSGQIILRISGSLDDARIAQIRDKCKNF